MRFATQATSFRTGFCWIALLALLSTTTLTSAQSPEPSPEHPFGQLGCSGVVPSSKGMYNAVLRVEEGLQDLTKKLAKESAPDSKEMAKLYLLVGQLNRWVVFLDHYREPAAVDWRFRAAYYHKFLLDARNRYYATPAAAKARPSVLKQLEGGRPSREKAMVKTLQMLKTGDVKQAENSIEKIQNEILSISGVLPDPDKKPYYDPMNHVVSEVFGPMSKYRNRETSEAEQNERDKLDKQVVEIEETLMNASGAEGLVQIAAQWKAIHLQRLRVHAFAHSAAYAGGSDLDAPMSTGPGADSKLSDDPSAKIKAEIADYVKRQAGNVAQSEATALFYAMQQTLAELTLRTDDSTWETALQKSLSEVAKKAQLATDVYKYQLATKDLLNWRERCASEWAAAKAELPAKTVAQQELGTTDNYTGMYERMQQCPLPLILKPLPDLVPDVEKRLVGKNVRTANVLPVDGGEKASWYTRSDDGFYFTLSSNPISQTVTPILRKELLCEGNNPPLSLTAAAALLSAQAGVAQQAGGKLTNFVLEGYVTRMTNIPAGQSCLIPFASLGPEPRGDSKRYLLVRCQLEPEWLQHRYFLVSNSR